jgi:hypothetical protein
MAFRSAELKRLYEQLQSLGIHISASDAAKLFAVGELAALVERSIDTGVSIRFLERAVKETAATRARDLRLYNDVLAELVHTQKQLANALVVQRECQQEVDGLHYTSIALEDLLAAKAWLLMQIDNIERWFAQSPPPGSTYDLMVKTLADYRMQLAKVNYDLVKANSGVNLLAFAQTRLDRATTLVREFEEQVNDISADVVTARRRFEKADRAWQDAVVELEAALRRQR